LKLPLIVGEEDTGPLVKALIDSQSGKHLIGYREWMTLPEMTAAFTAATGLPAEYVALPVGEPKGLLPLTLQQVVDDMWGYFNEFGYEAREDSSVIHPTQVCADRCIALHVFVTLLTFASWNTRRDCLVLPIGSRSRIGALLATLLSAANASLSWSVGCIEQVDALP
jgi:hypothetical protein